MATKPFVRVAVLQQAQPLVDAQGRPSASFVRLINDNNGNVAEAVNQIAVLPVIQEALEQAQQAVQEAQQGAQDAMDAASAANDAAAAAQAQTDATKREAALQGSYIEPASVLTATATTITVAAHTRRYADGTSKSVSAGTTPATGPADTDYVFYDDPARAGGSVTYQASEVPPVQTGNRHVVGAIVIPALDAPPAQGGEGPRRPGYVTPRNSNVSEQ